MSDIRGQTNTALWVIMHTTSDWPRWCQRCEKWGLTVQTSTLLFPSTNSAHFSLKICHTLYSSHLTPLLPFGKDLYLQLFISWGECCALSVAIQRGRIRFSARGLNQMWNKPLLKPTSVSFSFCLSRCVSPMRLALEAWGEVSQAQAPMGRPVIQHALLLLQCMLVLRPGGVAGRRGPVLLPESPCYRTEHPLVPHSGRWFKKCALLTSSERLFPFFPLHS